MAFNLGILGQVLTPAMAGLQRGNAMAEAEQYKRQREEEEAQRQARMQALQEELLRSREARDQEMHPLNMQTEKARALSALPTFAEPPEQLPGGTPSQEELLKLKEIQSRIDENTARAGYYRRMPRETSASTSKADPDVARREYLSKRIPDLQKPRTQKNEFGEDMTVPGLSTADAYRQAEREWTMMNGGGSGGMSAEERIASYVRSRGGMGGSSATGPTVSPEEREGALETAAPSTETTPTGDGKIRLGDQMQQRAAKQRWDELVGGGMDPDQATQQVLREFSR